MRNNLEELSQTKKDLKNSQSFLRTISLSFSFLLTPIFPENDEIHFERSSENVPISFQFHQKNSLNFNIIYDKSIMFSNHEQIRFDLGFGLGFWPQPYFWRFFAEILCTFFKQRTQKPGYVTSFIYNKASQTGGHGFDHLKYSETRL